MNSNSEKELVQKLHLSARQGDELEVRTILDNLSSPQKKSDGTESLPAQLPENILSVPDEFSGNTPLHLCCANGHTEVVRLLIARGAPVNAKNLSGSTPLHYASINGQFEVVQELVRANALLVMENNFGKTALDEALQGDYRQIADYLIAQAEQNSKKEKSSSGERQLE